MKVITNTKALAKAIKKAIEGQAKQVEISGSKGQIIFYCDEPVICYIAVIRGFGESDEVMNFDAIKWHKLKVFLNMLPEQPGTFDFEEDRINVYQIEANF